MQAEQIDFTFMLTAIGVVQPIKVNVTVNDIVVASGEISKSGGQQFVARTTLEPGTVKLAFNVPDEFKGLLRIDNVRVVWIADNSSLNSSWVSREEVDNEIWNYNDPAADAEFEKIVNGPATKFIAMDYMTDGTTPSFLRNYAYVQTKDTIVKIKDMENKNPYTFTCPGSFVIPITSPVAYWLMERLFVAL